MNFAETYYTGQHAAQEIMLITRDAIIDGNDPELATSNLARDFEYYRVWIFGPDEISFGTKTISAEFSPQTNLIGYRYVIIAITWNYYGNLVGRAVGTVPSW